MDNLGKWIIGGVTGFVSLIGLFISSHAGSPALYWLGLAISAIGIALIFTLIKRTFDEIDARRPAQVPGPAAGPASGSSSLGTDDRPRAVGAYDRPPADGISP